MRYFFSSFLAANALLLVACNNNNDSGRTLKKSEEQIINIVEKEPIVGHHYGSFRTVTENISRIIYTNELKADILVRPEYIIDHESYGNRSKIGYAFDYYNYGEDIRLTSSCVENIFISGISQDCYAFNVDRKNISIESIKHSNNYGNYAYVTVEFQGRIYRNVFLTPMAFNLYQEADKEEGIFVLSVFRDNYSNAQKIAIYRGDLYAEVILNYYPNSLSVHPRVWSKPGDDWKPFRSAEEQKKWESDQNWKRLMEKAQKYNDVVAE